MWYKEVPPTRSRTIEIQENSHIFASILMVTNKIRRSDILLSG